jgi:hypothetical protein
VGQDWTETVGQDGVGINTQLATGMVEPRSNGLQNITYGPSEMRRKIDRPLGFELPG